MWKCPTGDVKDFDRDNFLEINQIVLPSRPIRHLFHNQSSSNTEDTIAIPQNLSPRLQRFTLQYVNNGYTIVAFIVYLL